MKALIVYSGRYGSTRQYAEWISQELAVPAVDYKRVKDSDLAAQDMVILGSSVMMDSLSMKGWLKAKWPILKDRHPILFSVSATLPSNEAAVKAILEHSLSPEMITGLRFFPLHGRLTISSLPLLLRPLMKAVIGIADSIALQVQLKLQERGASATAQEVPVGEAPDIRRARRIRCCRGRFGRTFYRTRSSTPENAGRRGSKSAVRRMTAGPYTSSGIMERASICIMRVSCSGCSSVCMAWTNTKARVWVWRSYSASSIAGTYGPRRSPIAAPRSPSLCSGSRSALRPHHAPCYIRSNIRSYKERI